MNSSPLIWTQNREPNLLVPGAKPIGPVEVDVWHKFAPSSFWLLDGLQSRDLVSKTALTQAGTGGSIAHGNLNFIGSRSINYATTQLIGTNGGTPFDFVLQIKFRGAYVQALPHPLFQWADFPADGGPFQLFTSDTTHHLRQYNAGYTWTDTDTIASGEWVTLTFAGKPDGWRYTYKNGVLVWSADQGPTWGGAADDNKFWINQGYSSSTTDAGEYAYLAYWRDKGIPLSAIPDIVKDPFASLTTDPDSPFLPSAAIPPATGEDNAILMASNF